MCLRISPSPPSYAGCPVETGASSRISFNFRVGTTVKRFLFWLFRGLLIEHSRKVLCHRGLDKHAHELTKPNFAELCLERQFSNIFIWKAQRDRLFETSVLHCQGEVRPACLLVPDFLCATWYRKIFFLNSLQRLIDIGRGDRRRRYGCVCLPHVFLRHALGRAQPSLLQVEKMCLLGWHGSRLSGALRLLGTPIALVDQAGGHDRNHPVEHLP